MMLDSIQNFLGVIVFVALISILVFCFCMMTGDSIDLGSLSHVLEGLKGKIL